MTDVGILTRVEPKIKYLIEGPLSFLTDYEKSILLNHGDIIVIKKNELVFKYGDIYKFHYLVLDGVIKEFTQTSRKTIIRSVYHPLQMFALGMDKPSHHDSFAAAMTSNARVLLIDNQLVRTFISNNSQFCRSYIEMIYNQALNFRNRIEELMRDDARTRIVNFLIDNAKKYGVKIGMDEVLLKHAYTQQDIADFTGTSRQTIVTILNELRESNMIHITRHKMLIKDMDALITAY